MKITSAHISAIFAFSFWGLFPLYWKLFPETSSWDLFGHRFLWSFITLTLILLLRREMGKLKDIWKSTRVRNMLILSAVLISTNWLLYIYAIHTGKVLEASMGYFLNPLMNVFMGWILLKEKIRGTQWPSIFMAMIAMVLIALQADLAHFPWLALSLSLTFGIYGLIRKLAHVGSIEGLTFETYIMIIPVMIYWLFFQGTTPLTVANLMPNWKLCLLSLSGFISCLPLVLFAYSARRLELRTLGFIQYLSPSLKFLCGYLILKEPLSPERLQAFFIIWMALTWYTLESFYFARKTPKNAVAVAE